MSEKFVVANGIELAYEEFGDSCDPVMLLIMGLGTQMIAWPTTFCLDLAARGYRVIRFDNRDIGLSEKMEGAATPSVLKLAACARLNIPMRVPYKLHDMANDVIGLMEALDIDSAHLVGASMGGMIAQIISANFPDRVLSLTSIMSTTGAPHLPPPSAESSDMLKGLADNDDTNNRAQIMSEIGFEPKAIPRQLMAIIKTGDRSEAVATISVPTLVLHGADDNLLPVAHGEHTAELIKNSIFEVFQDMGHNLPETVLPKLLNSITTHLNENTPS